MQASSTWSWGCRCLCGEDIGSSVPASLLGLSPAIYAQLPCGAQVCFPIPTPTCCSLRKPNQRQRTGARTTCPSVHPASWRRRNLRHDQGETILRCIFKSLGLRVRLSLSHCPTGTRSFNLSEPQFLHLSNGDSKSSFAGWF